MNDNMSYLTDAYPYAHISPKSMDHSMSHELEPRYSIESYCSPLKYREQYQNNTVVDKRPYHVEESRLIKAQQPEKETRYEQIIPRMHTPDSEKYTPRHFRALGEHIVEWSHQRQVRNLRKVWNAWRVAQRGKEMEYYIQQFFLRNSFHYWFKRVSIFKKDVPVTIRSLLHGKKTRQDKPIKQNTTPIKVQYISNAEDEEDLAMRRSYTQHDTSNGYHRAIVPPRYTNKNEKSSIYNTQHTSPKRKSIGTRTVHGVRLRYTEKFYGRLLQQEISQDSRSKLSLALKHYKERILINIFHTWKKRSTMSSKANKIYHIWTHRLIKKCLITWQQQTVEKLIQKIESGNDVISNKIKTKQRYSVSKVFEFSNNKKLKTLNEYFSTWLTIFEFNENKTQQLEAQGGSPTRHHQRTSHSFLFDPDGRQIQEKRTSRMFIGLEHWHSTSEDDDDDDEINKRNKQNIKLHSVQEVHPDYEQLTDNEQDAINDFRSFLTPKTSPKRRIKQRANKIPSSDDDDDSEKITRSGFRHFLSSPKAEINGDIEESFKDDDDDDSSESEGTMLKAAYAELNAIRKNEHMKLIQTLKNQNNNNNEKENDSSITLSPPPSVKTERWKKPIRNDEEDEFEAFKEAELSKNNIIQSPIAYNPFEDQSIHRDSDSGTDIPSMDFTGLFEEKTPKETFAPKKLSFRTQHLHSDSDSE